MATITQHNWLGQARVDVPHLKMLESAVAYDFDTLAGRILAGNNPMIISGFTLILLPAGTVATSLMMQTASSVLFHPTASESGTIFQVPSNRPNETLNAANKRITGGFTASATNYIGIDLRRAADPTTADLVQFLNANTLVENPKTVPLSRTLDYAIIISTQDFSSTPGVAPLAKVVTDAFNNIVTIEDARSFQFRLGTGGTITNWKNQYPWPGGRGEPGSNGLAPNSDFISGDKAIGSFKEWQDAIMTRVWEIGGGEYWYSATADRNVKLIRTGSPFSNGDWFAWDGTNLTWQGLKVVFDNSTGSINTITDQTSASAGLTNLADGECLYVDLIRTNNATISAKKGNLATLGTPAIPGSRLVIAWRTGSGSTAINTRDVGLPLNVGFTVATTSAVGAVKLRDASGTPTTPLALTDGSMNIASGVAALDSNRSVIGTGLDRDTAGALTIGGQSATTNVNIGCFNTGATHQVVLNGVSGSSGAVQSINNKDRVATPGYLIHEFIAGDNVLGAVTVMGINAQGGLDMAKVQAVPGTPALGHGVLYVTDNGVASPSRVQQLKIKWDDGSIVVIASSAAH